MTPQEIFAHAIGHHQAGRFGPAEALYRELLAANPNHADALHLLGAIAAQQERPREAIDLIRRAIDVAPAGPYYMSLGESCRALGRWDEALAAYGEALKLNVAGAELHHAMGLTYDRLARTNDALESFRRAAGVQPAFLPAYHEQWAILMRERRASEAAEISRRAVGVDPKHPVLHAQLASALSAADDDWGAIEAFSTALRLQPKWAQVCVNLAEIYHRQGRWYETAIYASRAIEIEPARSDAYAFLALARERTGQLTAAINAGRKAVELNPQDTAARGNLAGVLLETMQFDESLAVYRDAIAACPSNRQLHSDYLLALNYPDSISADEVFEAHKKWAAIHTTGLLPANPPRPQVTDANRPLRVGYLSPDLREHPVAMFVDPLLSGHDRDSIHPIIYCDTIKPDANTARLRGLVPADDWRDVSTMNDDRLTELIHHDRIDLLIDLAGHTGRNRLTVFARRPAPLAATYLGYPNTTGLPREMMRYRLTDAICDPPGAADALHTEELVRLPGVFICYRPPAEAPAVGPPPSDTSSRLTFGSFNAMQKVSPTVVNLWADILRRVPGSRLVLKNRALDDEGVRQSLRDAFAGHGIDADRLEFSAPLPTIANHMARYGQVDIALDTFPYNGTTTTCDALWMGVPVITLAGQAHRSRVGLSLLTSVGLEALAAHSPEQYVELAVALAEDAPRRRQLRGELRERMYASPLTDHRRFVKNLEGVYRIMSRELFVPA